MGLYLIITLLFLFHYLEWPQKVRRILEFIANCEYLMYQVFNADDVALCWNKYQFRQ